jgi:hypothetical protein
VGIVPSSFGAGNRDILGNGNTHEMHHEQKSVDNAEKLKRDAVKVHKNDRQAQGKQKTRD